MLWYSFVLEMLTLLVVFILKTFSLLAYPTYDCALGAMCSFSSTGMASDVANRPNN